MSIDQKNIDEPDDPFMRRTGIADYCREQGLPFVTEPRLRRLNHEGRGPKFCYFGRYPVSRRSWVDEWISEQLSAVLTKTNGHRRREPRAA